MSTFYLHIGMHKTGSTALQNFFWNNRTSARQAGLAYPAFLESNHSAFFDTQFRSLTKAIEGKMHGRGKSSYLVDRDGLRQAFIDFLDESCRAGLDVLMSGEGASNIGLAGVRNLEAFLRHRFDRVVVLAMVRPPRSFARSAAQQRAKAGHRLNDLIERPPTPNYRKRFAPFLRTFGRENVRLGIFHPSRLVDGCILQTVLAMIDGDRSALATARAERTNEAISLTAAKVLFELNEALHTGEIARTCPKPVRKSLLRGRFGAALEEALRDTVTTYHRTNGLRRRVAHIRGPKFRLAHEIAAEAERACERDTRWMSRQLGDALADYDDPPEPNPLSLADYGRFETDEIKVIRRRLRRARL